MLETVLHIIGSIVVYVIAWGAIYGLLGGWRADKAAGRTLLVQEAVGQSGSCITVIGAGVVTWLVVWVVLRWF